MAKREKGIVSKKTSRSRNTKQRLEKKYLMLKAKAEKRKNK